MSLTTKNQVKSKWKSAKEGSSLHRKAKVLYFYDREHEPLNCEVHEVYSLSEVFNNENSQETFSVKEVAFYDKNQPQFYVYRGFNFSTSFEFDRDKKAFVEKLYDNKYMVRCRITQKFFRIFGKSSGYSFTTLISMIAVLISTGLITLGIMMTQLIL